MGCRNLTNLFCRGDFENLYKIALAKSDGHINEVAVTKVMLLTPLEILEEHRSNFRLAAQVTGYSSYWQVRPCFEFHKSALQLTISSKKNKRNQLKQKLYIFHAICTCRKFEISPKIVKSLGVHAVLPDGKSVGYAYRSRQLVWMAQQMYVLHASHRWRVRTFLQAPPSSRKLELNAIIWLLIGKLFPAS